MTDKTKQERLVDVHTAAGLLQVSEATLRYWLREGRYGLCPIKVGWRVYLERSRIDQVTFKAGFCLTKKCRLANARKTTSS